MKDQSEVGGTPTRDPQRVKMFQGFLAAVNEELVVKSEEARLQLSRLLPLEDEEMFWLRRLVAFHFDRDGAFEEFLECIREVTRTQGDNAPFIVAAFDVFRLLPDIGYAIGDAVLSVSESAPIN